MPQTPRTELLAAPAVFSGTAQFTADVGVGACHHQAIDCLAGHCIPGVTSPNGLQFRVEDHGSKFGASALSACITLNVLNPMLSISRSWRPLRLNRVTSASWAHSLDLASW